jgi:phosphopantetheinyl transferase (holo-ACP synthase)
LKCIAFSGKSIHSIEDQINYFLKENEGKIHIVNVSISTTEKNACAVVIYEEFDVEKFYKNLNEKGVLTIDP